MVQHINNHAVAGCFRRPFFYLLPPPCLTISQGSTNTLDGLQLNGLSQGAAFGDDYQSATNYPLVRIVEEIVPFCLFGRKLPDAASLLLPNSRSLQHGRGYRNLLVSTKFECPNVPIGFTGYLEVVANGIAVDAAPVIVGP